MSLSTHILDTSTGKPGNGIKVILFNHKKEEWIQLAEGETNADGRLPDLLKKDVKLDLGAYKLRFETQRYFSRQSIQTLYPFVEISFQITSEEHYHIPLLISPYGFSTYRGS